jgi:hypothetical protein
MRDDRRQLRHLVCPQLLDERYTGFVGGCMRRRAK